MKNSLFNVFHVVFYQPIFNVLILLVAIMPGHDLGLAIIVLTFIVNLVMWPLTAKALKSQRALAVLQPRLAELKLKYKDDKEAFAKETMALYAKEKVSPASSCLLILVQLPVFIALYQALAHGIGGDGLDALYSFIPNPGELKPTLLGILDLAKPSIVLAVAAGAGQFVQGWLTVRQQQPHAHPASNDEETMTMVNKQMMYMMPILTVVIGWKLPAGLTLYWFVMTVLSVLQQYLIVRPFLGKSGPKATPSLAGSGGPAEPKA
jgi:YidC/Oxa1 family membrane protein insertase